MTFEHATVTDLIAGKRIWEGDPRVLGQHARIRLYCMDSIGVTKENFETHVQVQEHV